MKKTDILIIGCGVSGLTCGVRLLEAGFDATIVASSIPPHTTSNVAAAIWYPYLASPMDRVLAWCGKSYEAFARLSEVEGSGVSLIEMHELFTEPTPDPYWGAAVTGFRRLGVDDLPDGYVGGYAATAPLIETPIYIPYLMRRFTALGGRIEKLDREIRNIGEVCAGNMVVVNCSGIGARELCKDPSVYPIRGQVLSVPNPGITRAIADETGAHGVSYVIPRSHDCILGGTAQENDWDVTVDEETSVDILNRCRQLEPKLRDVEIIEAKVGLRPGRKEIRLEIERAPSGCSVIHNYGHGGAGFTLSWGCAEEVVELARGALSNAA